jgi:hypothetical protein
MKSYNHLFFAILLLASCQKQPTASFTTDKETYQAGETIHCNDISNNAYRWTWTAPDGKIYTTRNLDWVTDSNDLGGTKTFTLEVASKNGKKNSTSSKSITLKELILSSDYFSFGSTVYKPTSKNCRASGNHWEINAASQCNCGLNRVDGAYLKIYLPNISAPTTSGTYTLISNSAVTAGTAFVYIETVVGETFTFYNSMSGQLSISITNNGRIHVTFNGVPTNHTGVNISGDITCH